MNDNEMAKEWKAAWEEHPLCNFLKEIDGKMEITEIQIADLENQLKSMKKLAEERNNLIESLYDELGTKQALLDSAHQELETLSERHGILWENYSSLLEKLEKEEEATKRWFNEAVRHTVTINEMDEKINALQDESEKDRQLHNAWESNRRLTKQIGEQSEQISRLAEADAEARAKLFEAEHKCRRIKADWDDLAKYNQMCLDTLNFVKDTTYNIVHSWRGTDTEENRRRTNNAIGEIRDMVRYTLRDEDKRTDLENHWRAKYQSAKSAYESVKAKLDEQVSLKRRIENRWRAKYQNANLVGEHWQAQYESLKAELDLTIAERDSLAESLRQANKELKSR